MMDTRYGPVKLKVPKGFPVLLQRFAREVIREQPDDIAAFGATFFQTLVVERKVTGEDPLECDPFDKPGFHAPPKVLRPISSKIRQKEIERERAATKIQASYRGFQVRKASLKNRIYREEQKREEEAAIRIQAHYRGFQTRKSISQPVKNVESSEETDMDILEEVGEVDELAKQGEHTLDAETSENLSSPTVISDESNKDEPPETDDREEQEAAAVKIQAVFRGRKSRKQQEKEDQNVIPKTYNKDEEVAAVKIQASFRGYQTRKKLSDNEDKNDDAQANYQENEEAAAVKIQATFRGHKTRKQLNKNKQNRIEQSTPQEESTSGQAPVEEKEDIFVGEVESGTPVTPENRDELSQGESQSQEENDAADTSLEESTAGQTPVEEKEEIFVGEVGPGTPRTPENSNELSQEENAAADTSLEEESTSGQAPVEEKEEIFVGEVEPGTPRTPENRDELSQGESQSQEENAVADTSLEEESTTGQAPVEEKEEILVGEVGPGTPRTPENRDELSQEESQENATTDTSLEEITAGQAPVEEETLSRGDSQLKEENTDADASQKDEDTPAVELLHQDETPVGDTTDKDEPGEHNEDKETVELPQNDDQSAGDANEDTVKENHAVETQAKGDDTTGSAEKESPSNDDTSPKLQDEVSAVNPPRDN